MSTEIIESVKRLTRDLTTAAATMSDDEARFLVDAYYMMQDDRKRSHNQVRALGESVEPHAVIAWLAVQSETLENQIKRALDSYTASHVMGSWMREIHGIGPVLSAGLLAHINIAECPTAGHIWRYAGLDPTFKWLGKDGAKEVMKDFPRGTPVDDILRDISHRLARREDRLRKLAMPKAKDAEVLGAEISRDSIEKALARRPWNGKLKTLCWKIGQSFMKFSNDEKCYYGAIYKQRKDYEIRRNERGENAQTAARILVEKKIGKSTEAYKWLQEGKLPPGQIDARSRRYAVKLFLSHLHGEWYRRHHGTEPPLPYPIAILGHAHVIQAP